MMLFLSTSDIPIAASQGPYEAYPNVSYCNDGAVMTIYVPSGPGPFPVVLFVPGGGWNATSPLDLINDDGWFFSPVISAGIAIADIGYRGYPSSAWPAQIEDVKCAVRFLKASAATYHLKPFAVGAYGQSVGNNLVDLLA